MLFLFTVLAVGFRIVLSSHTNNQNPCPGFDLAGSFLSFFFFSFSKIKCALGFRIFATLISLGQQQGKQVPFTNITRYPLCLSLLDHTSPEGSVSLIISDTDIFKSCIISVSDITATKWSK